MRFCGMGWLFVNGSKKLKQFKPNYVLRSVKRARRDIQAAGSLLCQKPYSLLSMYYDMPNWVLDQETRELRDLAVKLGIKALLNHGISRWAKQCCHYTSQFILLQPKRFATNCNRISIDYYHGMPGTEIVFDDVYEGLVKHHEKICRLRVSHSQMETIVKESGVDISKVHRIPIGINLGYFPMQNHKSKIAARKRLSLPQSAVVVGSFQKDGNGWGEGLEPKLIKGPDVFLKSVAILKQRIPELWVLLTGPARGYVKQGLERAGVPYRHVMLTNYPEIGKCYQALDAYIVASRQEGGPKAVLESMASGVPLVTTRVGQAMDLVHHGENGWMAEVEDAEGLAFLAEEALSNGSNLEKVARAGRATAEENSYDAQLPYWQKFFEGYVET